jgi:hypothetical protein
MIVLFWLEGSSPSILFKDAMILHQAKLHMQPHKHIPWVAQIKFERTADFQVFANRYGIKEFPTLILFDEEANPYKTVVGFSWFEVANLYALERLMGEKKHLKHLRVVRARLSSIVTPAWNRWRGLSLMRKIYAATASMPRR